MTKAGAVQRSGRPVKQSLPLTVSMVHAVMAKWGSPDAEPWMDFVALFMMMLFLLGNRWNDI